MENGVFPQIGTQKRPTKRGRPYGGYLGPNEPDGQEDRVSVFFVFMVSFGHMSTFILGGDHGGFALKEHLKRTLEQKGISYQDVTEDLQDGDDYPPIAQHVAQLMKDRSDTFGLLICRSGIGMDIAANRFRGIRATTIRTAEEAKLAREHNHANILVLGADFTSPKQAAHILSSWLDARPSYAQRHVRRVHQLDTL